MERRPQSGSGETTWQGWQINSWGNLFIYRLFLWFCFFFLFLPHHILHATVSTVTSSLPRGGRGGKLILFVVWSGVFLSSVILKISMVRFRQLDLSLQLEMFHLSSSNPRFGQSLVGHSGFVAQWRCSRQPSLHHARKVCPAQRPDKLCLTQNTTLQPLPRPHPGLN